MQPPFASINLDAVERGHDVAEAGLRMDDQGQVAAAEGAAGLAPAGRAHPGETVSDQPGRNVEALHVHSIGVDADLMRALLEEPIGHCEHDGGFEQVMLERAVMAANSVRRCGALSQQAHDVFPSIRCISDPGKATAADSALSAIDSTPCSA